MGVVLVNEFIFVVSHLVTVLILPLLHLRCEDDTLFICLLTSDDGSLMKNSDLIFLTGTFYSTNEPIGIITDTQRD